MIGRENLKKTMFFFSSFIQLFDIELHRNGRHLISQWSKLIIDWSTKKKDNTTYAKKKFISDNNDDYSLVKDYIFF